MVITIFLSLSAAEVFVDLSPLSPQAVRIAQASTPAVQRANALNSFLSFIFIVLSIIINGISAFSLAYYSTSLQKNQHQTMFFTEFSSFWLLMEYNYNVF